MVLLSLKGLPPAQNAVLLACHPAMVRRWISRFNCEKAAGLAGPAETRAARPASVQRLPGDGL
jgi:Homeodomain-like domain